MRQMLSLLGLAVLLLPGCAAVQSGVVWGADSFDRTVRIGPEVYQVTSDTDLYGPDGDRILFDEIPTFTDAGIGLRDQKRAEVQFQTSERAAGRHLDALWVLRP